MYSPPAPKARSNLITGLKIFFGRNIDLLETLPKDCYTQDIVTVPIGRRRVFIVNDPEMIKRVFIEDLAHYPKSDIMISALAPLLGEGILISNDQTWAHDRAMLDPAFALMRVEQLFPMMRGAVDDFLLRLSGLSENAVIDLEAELSRVTADIMFRALFSQPIDGEDASQVFSAFTQFQRNAPQFNLAVILKSDPDRPAIMPPEMLQHAQTLRGLMAKLLAARIKSNEQGQTFTDFAQSVIDARDQQGRPFSKERIIDQLAVFFLAGHETTASALAWTFFMLSQAGSVLARLRAEVGQVLAGRPFEFSDHRHLPFVRNVFRESLRLYPPAAFLTRRALKDDQLGRYQVPKDSFIVVSPWLVHRHAKHWQRPNAFDPDRFADDQPTPRMGTYIPFGLGPRVCTGAMIAQLEATMILAQTLRRFDFQPVDAAAVFPISKVTIRPRNGIWCRVATKGLWVS
jgi:cytochrome P450